MMKITIHNDAQATTLQLEGKLVGEWVKELLHCWFQVVALSDRSLIRIDLTGITFVDQAGKNLLRLINRHGAEFIAVEVLTRAIIEEIKQQ